MWDSLYFSVTMRPWHVELWTNRWKCPFHHGIFCNVCIYAYILHLFYICAYILHKYRAYFFSFSYLEQHLCLFQTDHSLTRIFFQTINHVLEGDHRDLHQHHEEDDDDNDDGDDDNDDGDDDNDQKSVIIENWGFLMSTAKQKGNNIYFEESAFALEIQRIIISSFQDQDHLVTSNFLRSLNSSLKNLKSSSSMS